jgi:hypothetical protein
VITTEQYLQLRADVAAAGYAQEIEWAQTVQPPITAEDFAGEAIWVICCSGFKAERARTTQRAVGMALDAGKSATTVFPKSGKGRAIDQIWKERHTYFMDFRWYQIFGAPKERIIEWIATLPYIGGPILRYHFAKNIGIDCAKPDRHLDRLARHHGTTPEKLCAELSAATGDRIATVDVVIWRACNLCIIKTLGLEPAHG